MDISRYNVRVQTKSVYVSRSAKGAVKGYGSPEEVLTEERAPNVELYAERWENGLDIWTGEPLTDEGLADWQRRRNDGRNQLE
jgi:hypothetical protein